MKKTFIWFVLCCMLLLCTVGCIITEDPITGEEKYRLDPNKITAIEGGAAGGVSILSALSVFIPALLPVSTAAAGALAAWAKIRPKFNEAKTANRLYYDIALSLVETIEHMKETNPEVARQILAKLEEVKNRIISPADRLKIENIIRGLRGLPPITG